MPSVNPSILLSSALETKLVTPGTFLKVPKAEAALSPSAQGVAGVGKTCLQGRQSCVAARWFCDEMDVMVSIQIVHKICQIIDSGKIPNINFCLTESGLIGFKTALVLMFG